MGEKEEGRERLTKGGRKEGRKIGRKEGTNEGMKRGGREQREESDKFESLLFVLILEW